MKRRSLESGNKLGIMISDDDILVDDIEDIEDDATQLFEHFRIDADKGQEPMRVDKFLFEHLQHSSRNRIQKAADAGFIHVNGKPVKSNYKVKPGDAVTLMLDTPRHDTSIQPEDIPLDIVYEDDEVMVVNKPAGMVVHPGVGNFHGTLVNAVAWHMRNVESYDPDNPEVGLVHRIDKDTSGLLVVAKTPEAKAGLGAQFFNKLSCVGMGQLCGRRGTYRRKHRQRPERQVAHGSVPSRQRDRQECCHTLQGDGEVWICHTRGMPSGDRAYPPD